MASIGERIVAAAVTQVDTVGKPSGLTVHRRRGRPLESETQVPAIILYAIEEPAERLDHDNGTRRKLTLRAELRAIGDVPDTAVDALYVWYVKRIRSDETFGGLAEDAEEKLSQWDAAVTKDGVLGARAVDFEITYDTSDDDPESGL